MSLSLSAPGDRQPGVGQALPAAQNPPNSELPPFLLVTNPEGSPSDVFHTVFACHFSSLPFGPAGAGRLGVPTTHPTPRRRLCSGKACWAGDTGQDPRHLAAGGAVGRAAQPPPRGPGTSEGQATARNPTSPSCEMRNGPAQGTRALACARRCGCREARPRAGAQRGWL